MIASGTTAKQRRNLAPKWPAVSFDLDGTLYSYDACHAAGLDAAADWARARLGFSRARFTRLYRDGRRAVQQRLNGTASSHNRLLYLHEAASRPASGLRLRDVEQLEAAYWTAFYRAMRPFRGMRRLLTDLKAASVKLAVTTDMMASVQFCKLGRLGLSDMFDVVVTSEESGAEKPRRAIFELCMRRLGVTAASVVHIGDDYERDVRGARRAGCDAILFGRANGRSEVTAASSFSELRQLLWHTSR